MFNVRERILAPAQQAFPPLVWEAPNVLRGVHRGCPVWISSESSDGRLDQLLGLKVALPELPLRLEVRRRRGGGVRMSGPAEQLSGDAAFDAACRLVCQPPLFVPALDARARQALAQGCGPEDSYYVTGKTRLAYYRLVPLGGMVNGSSIAAVTPAELKHKAGEMLYLVERLVQQVQQAEQEMTQAGGPEAAQHWRAALYQQLAAAEGRESAARGGNTLIALLIIAALFVLIVVVVILAVGAAMG